MSRTVLLRPRPRPNVGRYRRVPDTDLDTLLAKVAASPRRHVPPRVEAGTERYEFLSRLGRGAFGEVYEARDRKHGTVVALKRLKRPEPGWLYRFKREFRTVADLSHPNIVRLYELFCEGDHWYLTMERIHGLRFAEHLARAPEDRRSCFAQLAMAISALHGARCLHRDIKPSNVLVEPTGRVVLLDFGLAREGGVALATAIAGTPPYMAPELGMGEDPTEASDWYAFGVMLYESIAGRLPFDGTRSGMFQLKLSGPPSAPLSPGEARDDELERLALALLSPTPTGRPTGQQILALLADAVPARRPSPAADASVVVGRAAQLAQLADALERSRRGPVLVTLHGDPGMGKSTLARTFADRQVGQGARLYAGRCHESESLPFKGLDGVVDMMCEDLLARTDLEVAELAPPGAHALVQMFPVLKRVRELARIAPDDADVRTPHDARRAARAALRELLARLAEQHPVILVVDDLQWANDDSIGMLLDLLAPPAPRILTIVAYRRDSHGAGGLVDKFLMSALGRGNVDRLDIPLGPLDEAGVRELVSGYSDGGLDPERALRETGGHPYLLSRLVGAGTWDGAEGRDLTAVLGEQIGALSATARQVLEVVSLVVGSVSQRAAFAMAGAPWDRIAIDELRREKLVLCTALDADGYVEPYHARVRESVVASLAPERTRALHLTIASYLETRGRAAPESLVYHYRSAGQNELALKWTRSAARNAREAFAFARAAELFRDAVELAEDDDVRIELLVELAEAQVQAGHRADAGRSYLKAAELAAEVDEDELVAAMRTRAGQHFTLAGHIKRGIGLLRDALGAVGVALPADSATTVAATINVGALLATRGLAYERRRGDEVAPAHLRRLDLELAVGRALALTDMRATWVTSQALIEALEAGEPYRVQRAMAYYAFSNSARAPSHPVIVECVSQARSLAEELDDDVGRAWACLASGMWRAQRADFLPAVDELREARQRFSADSREHAREAAIADVAELVLMGNYGVNMPRAQKQYERVLDDALERDDLFAANWARALFAWIHLARNDVAGARQGLAIARQTWPAANEELFAAMALGSEIAIDLYTDAATSWATVARLRPVFEALYSSLIPMTRGIFHRLAASSALAALVAGGATRDETVARIDESVERVDGWEFGFTTIRAIDALACMARGDRAGYEANLAEAEVRWREQGQRGPSLIAQLRLAQSRGDTAVAATRAGELRAFGIADPDRFGALFAGPPVPV